MPSLCWPLLSAFEAAKVGKHAHAVRTRVELLKELADREPGETPCSFRKG